MPASLIVEVASKEACSPEERGQFVTGLADKLWQTGHQGDRAQEDREGSFSGSEPLGATKIALLQESRPKVVAIPEVLRK
jgi:hypothetical protein